MRNFIMRQILAMLLLAPVLTSYAQLRGDGYYRVHNLGLSVLQNRQSYVWVVNGKAEVITQNGTGQNFEAVALYPKETNSPVYEPASVIYAKLNGSTVDLSAQGVSVSKMTDAVLTWTQNGTANSYTLSTVKAGVTLYLWATQTPQAGHYIATTNNSNDIAYKFWSVEPISASSDNYFGVKPMLEAGGKYYAPFYASFPFKFASSGMKAYYVSSVNNEHYALTEISTEVKPGGTPMIIECSSPNVSDNRLELVAGSYGSISDNKLSGVYFCNDFIANDPECRIDFEPATMRVWNVENGNLVLSTATDNLHSSVFPNEKKNGYLNANQSYLKVSASAGQTLTFVATGIDDLDASAEAAVPINYTTAGGVVIDTPKKGMGIVIVRYSDGTVRSVLY